MTNEEINIAIAESLGWAFSQSHVTYPHGLSLGFHPPEYVREVFIDTIPNYAADLNACHEFEKVLYIQNETAQQAQKRVFYEMLLYDFDNHPIHATARQRCVAYLRTIGKWKE